MIGAWPDRDHAEQPTTGEPDDRHTAVRDHRRRRSALGHRPGPPVDALHPALGLRGRRRGARHRPWRGRLRLGRQGRRYLDGLSGLFVVQAGHGRVELAEAAARQATELAYFPLWSYAHPTAITLAERLAAAAPGDLNRVFFTTGGGEAIETAWKLAKQYWKLVGKPMKHKVISRAVAYHGTPQGALAITGVPAMRMPFEPLVPGAAQGAEHELLPGPRARRRPRGVRPLGRRPDRARDPDGGRGLRGGGLPGAGPELRRLLPAAARLLRPRPRDLRPARRAAGVATR